MNTTFLNPHAYTQFPAHRGRSSGDAHRTDRHINVSNLQLVYLCPHCSTPLQRNGETLVCPQDGYTNTPEQGIRDVLTADELIHHIGFLNRYREIRERENHGSHDPTYYLNLPEVPSNDPQFKEWQIRAESMEWLHFFLRTLYGRRKLTILDAGAGNCWLTRHMVEWGHEVVALDLNMDERNGLAAGRHYLEHLPITFERVRADFEHLPFEDATFDLVVFNKSFHYAENPTKAMAEAVRVTKPEESIVILDSPIYTDRETGLRTVTEEEFEGRAGFLTYDQLWFLGDELNLHMETHPRPQTTFQTIARRATALKRQPEPPRLDRIVYLKYPEGM